MFENRKILQSDSFEPDYIFLYRFQEFLGVFQKLKSVRFTHAFLLLSHPKSILLGIFSEALGASIRIICIYFAYYLCNEPYIR